MNLIQRWMVTNLEDLKQLVSYCKQTISEPAIVLLQGPMGIGKTQWVQFWCEKNIVSPTYALHHSYQLSLGQELEHFDLYRLQSEDDLESTGFWDLIQDDGTWVFIEWPERLQIQHLPLHRSRFLIDFKWVENKSADAQVGVREISLYQL